MKLYGVMKTSTGSLTSYRVLLDTSLAVCSMYQWSHFADNPKNFTFRTVYMRVKVGLQQDASTAVSIGSTL